MHSEAIIVRVFDSSLGLNCCLHCHYITITVIIVICKHQQQTQYYSPSLLLSESAVHQTALLPRLITVASGSRVKSDARASTEFYASARVRARWCISVEATDDVSRARHP